MRLKPRHIRYIILITLLAAFAGFMERALNHSLYEIQIRMSVGQTARGCVEDDPPNLPLFQSAALALPTSDSVLQATIADQHLSTSLQDLRGAVQVGQDDVGLIIVHLRYPDMALGRQVARTLADETVGAFTHMDQTTGAMKRLCNRAILTLVHDTPLPAKWLETDYSIVPLVTGLIGLLIPVVSILASKVIGHRIQ